ncbi:hypothetical protein CR513_49770, partial [Mucuna pruriens]
MAPYEALYGRRCRTPLCWCELEENVVSGLEVKLIQENIRVTQNRQKIYHDKKRKDLEFNKGNHIFLKVTPWSEVGKALKSHKLSPRSLDPYQILKRVSEVAYQIAFLFVLANLHDVFHLDDIQVRDNLSYEVQPLKVKGRRVKELRGKEILLVKVV